MATFIKISTLTGGTISIAAAAVWRIAHGVPDDAGNVHTQVDYDGGLQLTDEPVAKLVGDLSAANVKMIALTAPGQSTIYLNAADVTAVQPSLAGVDAPGSQSAIIVVGHRQAVTETPAEVQAAL